MRRALEILAGEVDRVMALIGCTDVASLTPDYLLLPAQRSFDPVETKRLVS